MDDEEFLEIDSPDQHAVDIEEDEEDQEIEGLDLRDAAKGSKAAQEGAAEAGISSSAANGTKSQKKDPRLEMLDWPGSLPYECETLDEFDDRVDQVVRRLVDCVKTRE